MTQWAVHLPSSPCALLDLFLFFLIASLERQYKASHPRQALTSQSSFNSCICVLSHFLTAESQHWTPKTQMRTGLFWLTVAEVSIHERWLSGRSGIPEGPGWRRKAAHSVAVGAEREGELRGLGGKCTLLGYTSGTLPLPTRSLGLMVRLALFSSGDLSFEEMGLHGAVSFQKFCV